MMQLPDFLRRSMLADCMREAANAREPDAIIPTRDGAPYLRRWHLLPRGDGMSCYLHHFLASDDDRALHDHPWPSLGILLDGSYIEHLPEGETMLRHAGDVILRTPEHTHRVELLRDAQGRERQVWTLFLVGHRIREWGFHCADGWTPWHAFVAPGPDGISVGCG